MKFEIKPYDTLLMAAQIRTIGQFNPIHFSTVADNWDPFDQKQGPIDGQTRHRNNSNLSHAMRLAKKEPRVLILGSGRCKEFDLARVTERSGQVTLVDIRESSLSNAAKSIDKKLRKKLDLVQADLSPFDSHQFFDQAGKIIREAQAVTHAIQQLRDLLHHGIIMDQDPLAWFNGQTDLAVLINTISPMTYDFLYWPTMALQEKWLDYDGGTFKVFTKELLLDFEGRMLNCFLQHLRRKISPGGIVYAVVYHTHKNEDLYPLSFYQTHLSKHFTVLEERLPFTSIEYRTEDGNENIAFLLQAS